MKAEAKGRRQAGILGALAVAAAAAAALTMGALQAQPAPERDRDEQVDEITVTGQRSLGAWRREIRAVRERMYDAFNELTSVEEFRIRCYNTSRAGTRIRERVCTPQYFESASAFAAMELYEDCRPELNTEPWRPCDFGINAMQVEDDRVRAKDVLLAQEFERIAEEHPQFQRLISQYREMHRQYQHARRGTDAGNAGSAGATRVSIARVR